jgi:formamidopyrimidine-DNA glycosylase
LPEIPEIEALKRVLDDPVRAFPIVRAGPAHVATLKTFDPPLRVLEGRRFSGVERRAKRLLFPTGDGELVVLLHLMTNGRLRYLLAGEQGPKAPAFQLEFAGGGKLVLTERGSRKQAGVWLLTPEGAEAQLAHIGPDALGMSTDVLAAILREESRRLHPLLRDQRAIAGIGRAWSNEILHHARLSPFAVSTELEDEEVDRLSVAMQDELERGLELRLRGWSDKRTYRVHGKLREPCYVCGTSIERIEYESHTVYYCPACQTGGRVLKDRRLSRLLR